MALCYAGRIIIDLVPHIYDTKRVVQIMGEDGTQSKVTVVPNFDSSASIRLVKNLNDQITYQSNASANQFAVFSEIYYPKGWKAFIDENEPPIVKVDYALRGVNIPSGSHTIRFEFAPVSYTLGNTLNLAAGIISIVALLICAILLWMQRKKIA